MGQKKKKKPRGTKTFDINYVFVRKQFAVNSGYLGSIAKARKQKFCFPLVEPTFIHRVRAVISENANEDEGVGHELHGYNNHYEPQMSGAPDPTYVRAIQRLRHYLELTRESERE